MFVLALCLVYTGCGTVGEPVYPSAHIPVAPSDLNAVQRGDRIVVYFTAPALTTDGKVMTQIGGADVRVGSAARPFNADKWAATATHATVKPATKPGPVEATAPLASGLASTDLVVGARVLNSRGRASAWSNFVTVHVVAPVIAPAGVTAAAAPEGVRVTWTSPADYCFRVFRQGPDDKEPQPLDYAESTQYIDRTIVWGSQYQYWVQAFGNGAESEAAASQVLTPVDKFPPAVPIGLTAVTGVGSIELAWERNGESDFKNYVIYRAVGDGRLQKLGESDVPVYSDKAVETGKRYRYAVAAVDQRGNLSEMCAPVEAAAP
jgi:sarcosine oxidase gamma subunit